LRFLHTTTSDFRCTQSDNQELRGATLLIDILLKLLHHSGADAMWGRGSDCDGMAEEECVIDGGWRICALDARALLMTSLELKCGTLRE
jgi:hypothetical protein